MNAYKVTIKEELAIRQWQNVLAFGTVHSAVQKNNVQQDKSQMTYEVLP